MALQAKINLIAQSIKSDAGTVTAYSFDVENTSDRTIVVGIEPLGESKEWIKLVKSEHAELELPARAVQRVGVNITVPTDASAKRYSFKLRIYDARTPTLTAESGAVAIEVVVPATPAPRSAPAAPTAKRPNWPIIIAATVGGLVLIGAIVGVLILLSGGSESVPNLIGQTAEDAAAALRDEDYAAPVVREEVTGEQEPGRVARQSPEPGADKPADGVVRLIVEADTPSPPTPPPRKYASLVGDWLGAPGCTLTFRVDNGKDLEGHCDTPGFRHEFKGAYETEERVKIAITRVDGNNCTTTDQGYIRIENDDTIEVSQDGWNGCNVKTGPARTRLQRSARR